jgi:hypothetical protein
MSEITLPNAKFSKDVKEGFVAEIPPQGRKVEKGKYFFTGAFL